MYALTPSPQVRTGENDKKMNLPEVLDALAGTGAAAVTVHGRTSQQRYKNKADWDLIAQSVGKLQPLGLPLIGNGDILTHFEVCAGFLLLFRGGGRARHRLFRRCCAR